MEEKTIEILEKELEETREMLNEKNLYITALQSEIEQNRQAVNDLQTRLAVQKTMFKASIESI